MTRPASFGPTRGEGGSVTVLAVGALLLAGVVVLASVDLMRAVGARARAQVAADAAALAAAQEIALPSGLDPTQVAGEYAGRNGAALVSCNCDPGSAEAVVEVEAPVDLIFVGADRTVRASARAVIEGAEGRDRGPASTMAANAGAEERWDKERAPQEPGGGRLHAGQAGPDPGVPKRGAVPA